jgi:hypothetical protein
MKFIHYSNKIIEKLEDRPYEEKGREWYGKPSGFWFSVEGEDCVFNWREWCEGENFRVEHLKFPHEIILNEDAKIINLKTHQDILDFTKKYPYLRDQWNDASGRRLCKTYELDWSKVKQEYQGIIISPYQWECRLNSECDWYYTWDCSSGCIWDMSCIKEFNLL